MEPRTTFNKTKIVATVGPASNTYEKLGMLIKEGVDVFRLNFSHGTREAHAEVYHRVRAAAARAGCIVAVMQDLSGPKIRTTTLAGGTPITLSTGSELRIRGGEDAGRATPGALMPLFSPRGPPSTTVVTSSLPSALVTRSSILPSSSSSRSPGFADRTSSA